MMKWAEERVVSMNDLKGGKNQKADCCSRLTANSGERCLNHVFGLVAQ